jgi:hypothetical protein
MTLAVQETLAPSGWYADPAGSGMLRWWTGATWTMELMPDPTAVALAYPTRRLPKPGM